MEKNSTNLEKIHTSPEALLIDLLISNNFSSMTFFCATCILRVIGRQPSLIVRQMSYEIIRPSHGQNIFHTT